MLTNWYILKFVGKMCLLFREICYSLIFVVKSVTDVAQSSRIHISSSSLIYSYISLEAIMPSTTFIFRILSLVGFNVLIFCLLFFGFAFLLFFFFQLNFTAPSVTIGWSQNLKRLFLMDLFYNKIKMRQCIRIVIYYLLFAITNVGF